MKNQTSTGKDVTVIGWGSQMYVLEQAVKMAEEKLGVSCELIDLRTILPYDFEAIEKVLCACVFFKLSKLTRHLSNIVC
jgi:pyruvate/2-oxoglutarate/acetoin dehydrogenase E1 component